MSVYVRYKYRVTNHKYKNYFYIIIHIFVRWKVQNFSWFTPASHQQYVIIIHRTHMANCIPTQCRVVSSIWNLDKQSGRIIKGFNVK